MIRIAISQAAFDAIAARIAYAFRLSPTVFCENGMAYERDGRHRVPKEGMRFVAKKFPLVSRNRFEDIRTRFRKLSQDHESLLADHEKLASERDGWLSVMDRLQAVAEKPTGATLVLDSLSQEADSKAMLSDLAGVFRLSRLLPVATCRTKADWDQFCASAICQILTQVDESILKLHQFEEEWELSGYSSTAGQFVNFKVDNQWGGRSDGIRFLPNVRERLVCPVSGLNNRQRLMASLVSAELSESGYKWDIYFMEQVTPIFRWVTENWGRHRIVGSEYLGDGFLPAQIVGGIRHEDIQQLSFEDSSIDLIISTDVMEHVPNPRQAFAEIYRVLRPGGQALMTFPFFDGWAESVVRAEVRDGTVVHQLSPVYHGNPLSAEGSLVFTDFGWDVLDQIRTEGFRDCALEIYHSEAMAHLGMGVVFRLLR
jgi:SAM-dependent methyltransferase